MIHKNTFEYVDILYLEFHGGKVHKSIEDDKKLLEKLSAYKQLQVFTDTYNHFNFV